jgi:predicted nucleic acid-binding protein
MAAFLIDNDVFFASLYTGHANHKISREWLDQAKPQGWAIATETFLGAMRLLMNPAVMGATPLTGAMAWSVVQMECAGPFPAEPIFATKNPDEQIFQQATGHKQVMDFWLIQLAREHQLKLATRDQGLLQNWPKHTIGV